MNAFVNELMGFWSEWVRPSAGFPTVAWSLLLVPILGILAAISLPAYQEYVERAEQAQQEQQLQYAPEGEE